MLGAIALEVLSQGRSMDPVLEAGVIAAIEEAETAELLGRTVSLLPVHKYRRGRYAVDLLC